MEMKRSNGSWICEFIEQLSYDGHMKVERRCSPVKLGFAALRSRSSPNDPSRKHAVEQSLNQCRSEKVFTVLPFKFHTKGVFQGSSNAGQEEGRCSLDASECVLGVGGEQGGNVFRGRKPSGAEHNPAEVFFKPVPDLLGRTFRVPKQFPKFFFVRGQTERFQLGWLTLKILSYEHEISQISYKHLSVSAPVATHLLSVGGQPGVFANGLDLNNATVRQLTQQWFVWGPAELLLRK